MAPLIDSERSKSIEDVVGCLEAGLEALKTAATAQSSGNCNAGSSKEIILSRCKEIADDASRMVVLCGDELDFGTEAARGVIDALLQVSKCIPV